MRAKEIPVKHVVYLNHAANFKALSTTNFLSPVYRKTDPTNYTAIFN